MTWWQIALIAVVFINVAVIIAAALAANDDWKKGQENDYD